MHTTGWPSTGAVTGLTVIMLRIINYSLDMSSKFRLSKSSSQSL